MSKIVTSTAWRGGALRKSVLGMAVATALTVPSMAAAMELYTGDELSFRWDNTLRVNIADRMAGQNKQMMANPNYDDGDRNFNVGSIWTRFDVLSEMDLVWKPSWGTLGARVSAAGWWDPGYQSLDNTSLQTANNLKNGYPTLDLSDTTKRYGEGPSGEFLDWFLFGSFSAGGTPINVKVGQTTVYWGEALFNFGNSISYGQNPVDVWKALSTPGVEAKEVFRPRLGFNINSQVTDDLNIAAQYFFNWQDFQNQSYRYPEAGSYLTLQDGLLWGGHSIITGLNPLLAAPPATQGQLCTLVALAGGTPSDCFSQQYLRLWHNFSADQTPDENSGNYGIALRWAPEWAAGTIGGYYRRTYDMQPQVVVTPDAIPIAGVPITTSGPLCQGVLSGLFLPSSATSGTCLNGGVAGLLPSPPYPAGTPLLSQTGIDFITAGRAGSYNLAYGSDIDIFGLSYSRNVGSLSVSGELSYRTNMPLLSEPVKVLPAALKPYLPLPDGAIWSDKIPKNDTPGAKGDTMHGVLDILGVLGESIWDTASWAAELNWMTWLNVSQNEGVFKGRSGYKLIDAVDKNYFGLNINFTPTWFQVRPGMDVLTPISWSQGISGNAAITGVGQEGAGTVGIGIALDFYQKYRFDLKYVAFYGQFEKCSSANAAMGAGYVGTCVGASGSDMAVLNGTNATLADRDFIALTFKTTF
jgi:hypothetical protein